jgi:hypothetical protein
MTLLCNFIKRQGYIAMTHATGEVNPVKGKISLMFGRCTGTVFGV